MFSIDRINRLQEIIDRHSKRLKSSSSEKKFTSGGLGTNNLGYLPQEDGSIIHIVETTLKDHLGPGLYDPKIPGKSISYTISHSKRPKLMSRDITPSPCDYSTEQKNTKIMHKLQSRRPLPADPAPLGGELQHPDWKPKQHSVILTSRNPLFQYKDDMSSKEFSSTVERKLFPEPKRIPCPTKYAVVTDGVGDIERQDEGDAIFKCKVDRFEEPKSYGPAPDTYYIKSDFGESNTKIIVEPNENIEKLSEILRSREVRPSVGTYLPEILNKPNTKRKSSFFASKTERNPFPTHISPSPDKYSVIRRDSSTSVCIRPKVVISGKEWHRTGFADTPSCTQYDIPQPKRSKGGYISSLGHRTKEKKQTDYPLAFRTQHSSFIKKSYNIRYKDVELFNV